MVKGPSPQNRAKVVQNIASQVQRAAGKGIKAGAVFIAARIKETVSVPAPRRRGIDRSGNYYYYATTRATPGAPPRKLSGTLRQRVTYKFVNGPSGETIMAIIGVYAKTAKGFNYPRHLEETDHKFFYPTLERYWRELRTIITTKAEILY